MNFTENSDKQIIIDDRLHHFIETETKKQQFQVSFGFICASKLENKYFLFILYAFCENENIYFMNIYLITNTSIRYFYNNKYFNFNCNSIYILEYTICIKVYYLFLDL